MIKKETMFDQSHIEEHTAAVIEEVLKRLADQRKPFKYVGEEHTHAGILSAVPALLISCCSDMHNNATGGYGDSHGNVHALGPEPRRSMLHMHCYCRL